MSISPVDVMDQMIEKILGNDKHYTATHYLIVSTTPGMKLQKYYGTDCQLMIKQITREPYHNGKFVISLAIRALTDFYRPSTKELINYHEELADLLRILKEKVYEHRKRQLEIEEHRKRQLEIDQAELEKLYNQYGGHACKSL